MKYEQIRNLLDKPFRRLTGVKRQTFEKIVKILTDSTNSIDSSQNGSTEKLTGKGRAGARDRSFERSPFAHLNIYDQ